MVFVSLSQSHEGWEQNFKFVFENFMCYRLDHIVVFASLERCKRIRFHSAIATFLCLISDWPWYYCSCSLCPSSIHMHFYLFHIVWSTNVFNYSSGVLRSQSVTAFAFADFTNSSKFIGMHKMHILPVAPNIGIPHRQQNMYRVQHSCNIDFFCLHSTTMASFLFSRQ